MTVIVRHDNTLYFDDLILTANHVGGTFAKAPHPKVYRHPNFNALIGVSGAIAGNIFNKINIKNLKNARESGGGLDGVAV